MPEEDDDDIHVTPLSSPEQILEAARRWGVNHGRLLATDSEVREAVLEGRWVDWCEWPDLMWETIGLGAEEDISQLPLELRIEAENAAGCAAQAEGERCSRLPEEEFRDLVGEDAFFDGDPDDDLCPRQ